MLSELSDEDDDDQEPPKKIFFFDRDSSYNKKRKRNKTTVPVNKPNIYATLSNVKQSNKSAEEKARMLHSAARKL